MRKLIYLAANLFALLALPCTAQDQKFTPRSIEFTGAPQFTKSELMAATNLHPHDALTVAEMRARAALLVDTGLFEKVSFTFTGVDLAYQLKPFPELSPALMPNFPPIANLDLESSLRKAVPLYHGRVPADSGLSEQVRAAMEQILAANGIQATVVAAPNSGPAARNQPGINFLITSPDIKLGKISVTPASGAIPPAALAILNHIEGSAYDTTGSPNQISTYLTNYYHDAGFLEAQATPHLLGTSIATADTIAVPFSVDVQPGLQYKLDSVQLDPAIPMQQADFDKNADLRRGQVAGGQELIKCWELVARQFHNHGFMSPSVHPEPSFDRAKATVSFKVTATPGPVYTMGKLTLENASEEFRKAFLAAWPLSAGAVYNEGLARGFFATHDVHPYLEQTFATNNVRYEQRIDESTHTVDLTVKISRK